MSGRAKYRKVTDLYVEGTVVELRGGTPLWVQALNPYELDEVRHDAQIARARLTLALKGPEGGDERKKVESAFYEDGRDRAVLGIAQYRAGKKLPDMVEAVRNDPDWKERLDILERSDDILAKPIEDPERELLDRINKEYVEEIEARHNRELDWQKKSLEQTTDAQLIEEYADAYLDRRASELARGEYELAEMFYAARVCDAVKKGDDWDHEKCQHKMRAFESKAEVRDLPEGLQKVLKAGLAELNLAVREAKN